MKRNAATLRAVGHALYGPSWRKPLGLALAIHERTLRRWLSDDDTAMPDGVWIDIAALCTKRAEELLIWIELGHY